jgi:hypothetical protein
MELRRPSSYISLVIQSDLFFLKFSVEWYNFYKNILQNFDESIHLHAFQMRRNCAFCLDFAVHCGIAIRRIKKAVFDYQMM